MRFLLKVLNENLKKRKKKKLKSNFQKTKSTFKENSLNFGEVFICWLVFLVLTFCVFVECILEKCLLGFFATKFHIFFAHECCFLCFIFSIILFIKKCWVTKSFELKPPCSLSGFYFLK